MELMEIEKEYDVAHIINILHTAVKYKMAIQKCA